MDYLKFTRNHSFIFISLILFIIFFITFFLCFVFGIFSEYLKLDIFTSALAGFTISFTITFFVSISMVYRFKSVDTARFVDNLGSIVNKKEFFSTGNLIITKDFNPLKILDFKAWSNYSTSQNKIYFSKGVWGELDRKGDALGEKAKDIYKKSYEGNFSFEFFLSKEEVKIKIPEFQYFTSTISMSHNFENWKSGYYQYPSLYKIIEKLPDWITRTEICLQGNDVSVGIFADRAFCLNNSLDVYNELVKLKKELTQ